MRPAEPSLFAALYEPENRMLFTELFRFCPEHRGRVLPFAAADPLRRVPEQLAALRALVDRAGVDCYRKSLTGPPFCVRKTTSM